MEERYLKNQPCTQFSLPYASATASLQNKPNNLGFGFRVPAIRHSSCEGTCPTQKDSKVLSTREP